MDFKISGSVEIHRISHYLVIFTALAVIANANFYKTAADLTGLMYGKSS